MVSAINKTSLANQYGWSLKFLMNKINTTKELYQELKIDAGYRSHMRILTPKQVEIIYKYFGEPETK